MTLQPPRGEQRTVWDFQHRQHRHRFLLLARRPPGDCDRLRLFGHRDQVLTGDFADQLGMIGAHVRFDHRRRFLNGLATGLQNSAILLATTLRDKRPTRIQLCGRLSVPTEIRLELPPEAWIDLEAAEAAIHRAEAAVMQADWARGWGPSLIALFTARRGFLPGEDLPWAHEHRRRLEEIQIAALECYAAVALGIGGSELPPGERAARELVEIAPYHERAHRLLMQLLSARQRRRGAARLRTAPAAPRRGARRHARARAARTSGEAAAALTPPFVAHAPRDQGRMRTASVR